MVHRSCPACGSRASGQHLFNVELRTPDSHPLQGGYPVVSCRNCGTGFADVVVPKSYYVDYYANLAKYGFEHETITTQFIEPIWVSDNATRAASWIAGLIDIDFARVLDIGCSTGALLSAMYRLGYREALGIDPSSESVNVASSREGVKVEVGSFEAVPSSIGKFDCVCLTGVLEHLWDLDEAMSAIVSLLNAGGIVYVEIPDADRYVDPYVAPFEDFSTEHVNHFSLSSLKVLASRFGLETIFERRTETPLGPDVRAAAVAVAWRVNPDVLPNVEYDTDLVNSLKQYVDQSSRDFREIRNGLDQRLGKSDEYILWGIGETSFKLLALDPLRNRRAAYFVDSNASRRQFTFDGTRVLEPANLISGGLPIVASSLIRATAIVDASRSLGLENPVIRLDDLFR